MPQNMMDSIAIIELMLKDLQDEHGDALTEMPEVGTGIQMAYKQIFNTRLKCAQMMERTANPVEHEELATILSNIKLTNIEKWVLRSLGDREEGLPSKMIRAEHDRLISNELIKQTDDRYFITAIGKALLMRLIKLPGVSEMRVPKQAVV